MTRELKRLLKIIVKTEIFKNENLPEPTNKRFFPRTSTIRNLVTHAKRKLCHSLIDQECLQEKIDQWETADKSVKIFFVLKVLLNKMVMKIQAMALILTVMIILMICVQEKLRELFYCLFPKTDDKERYFLAMERS